MLEKFFEGNYHWIIIIALIIWLLSFLSPDYETKKQKEERLKKEAAKNTDEVNRILKDGQRYRKNPILYYRELIKDEKYRKAWYEMVRKVYG